MIRFMGKCLNFRRRLYFLGSKKFGLYYSRSSISREHSDLVWHRFHGILYFWSIAWVKSNFCGDFTDFKLFHFLFRQNVVSLWFHRILVLLLKSFTSLIVLRWFHEISLFWSDFIITFTEFWQIVVCFCFDFPQLFQRWSRNLLTVNSIARRENEQIRTKGHIRTKRHFRTKGHIRTKGHFRT